MMRVDFKSGVSLAFCGVIAASLVRGPGVRAGESDVHLVSGRSVTTTTCPSTHGNRGEVSLAIDHGTGEMVAAWMQDLGPDSATRRPTVVTASSRDGGGSWTPATVPPGVSICAGLPGVNPDTADPSVSVGPDGRGGSIWYLGQVAGRYPVLGPVYVSTSHDGTTWSRAPVLLPESGPLGGDFDKVVADPTTPGRAYVSWAYLPLAEILISETTDGGQTFSTPAVVDRAPPGNVESGSHLFVLADGSLLDLFFEIPDGMVFLCPPECSPAPLWAARGIRASNGTITWAPKVRLGTNPPDAVVDPNGTTYVAAPTLFSAAAGPDAAAEAVWTTTSGSCARTDSIPTPRGHVCIALTSDGGRTWSTPIDVAPLRTGAKAFEASVAAAADGTLAVTWYEFVGTATDGTLPTTLWLTCSSDHGATWSTPAAVAGPFNMRTAKRVGGGYLGDFQSLVPDNHDGSEWEAAFTLAGPQAPATFGPTAIFSAGLSSGPAGSSTTTEGQGSTIASTGHSRSSSASANGLPSTNASLGAGSMAAAFLGVAALLPARRRRRGSRHPIGGTRTPSMGLKSMARSG